MATQGRYEEAIRRFDAANAEDPRRVTIEGVEQPTELLYARRMTARLERFAADAPEIVRLAARAQHIRRWEIPRDRYPMDRAGYRRWRVELASFHAETAGRILADVGYDPATIARVGSLLRKEKLKTDPDVQLLEDVICLVFLEHYLVGFAREHDEEKIVGILRKTWRKMSPRGQAAIGSLDLPPEVAPLIARLRLRD